MYIHALYIIYLLLDLLQLMSSRLEREGKRREEGGREGRREGGKGGRKYMCKLNICPFLGSQPTNEGKESDDEEE